MNLLLAKEKINEFLLEDIGSGDLSTNSIFDKNDKDDGIFIAKQDGIVSGIDIPNIVYEILGGQASFTPHKFDGETVKSGETIGVASGSIQSLLTGERVILNLMQRMSGISTVTAQAVKTLDDPNIRICDTRKTAPGLRMFDKYSVRMGGGYNHRVGLYDGVMLKDNHIAYAGGIQQAVEKVRDKIGHMVKIEVEVERLDQVKQAVDSAVDVIMFDNRSPEEVKEFAKYVPAHITTEISGGINLQNINSYKGTNADYISLGFLTHSIKALDISFNHIKGDKIWRP
ncbi:carboxylating nicotinate-nucleotide diphosphorylase [Metaclostridioides mangenotii]|uniref:carboxylating nicotinate-nucleotide diphosphorylase n=1 Tax=Metaclostridioides mangenotii TaxID=1540 RepID=UPI000465BBF5|nr:carboxylating nicotinate-nucleotide diphosphorylase [Clostridioides mangenotii]